MPAALVSGVALEPEFPASKNDGEDMENIVQKPRSRDVALVRFNVRAFTPSTYTR